MPVFVEVSDYSAKCLDGFRYLEIGSDHSDSAAPPIAEESLLFFWFSLENQINKRNIFHFWPESFPQFLRLGIIAMSVIGVLLSDEVYAEGNVIPSMRPDILLNLLQKNADLVTIFQVDQNSASHLNIVTVVAVPSIGVQNSSLVLKLNERLQT